MHKLIKRVFCKTSQKLIAQTKYRQARFYLSEILTQKKESLSETEFLNKINQSKQLIFCEIKLKDFFSAEKRIEETIEEINSNTFLNKSFQIRLKKSLYEIYFLYLLKNNPQKGEEIGTELFIKEQDPEISRMLNFYLGTNLILTEKFNEAKDNLYVYTGSNLDQVNSAMAFNSLGVACWWDMHPNYSSIENDFENQEDDEEEDFKTEYSEQALRGRQSDFKFAPDMFQSSVYRFEMLMEGVRGLETEGTLSPQSPDRIEHVFEFINCDFDTHGSVDKFNYIMGTNQLVQHPQSAVPLFNLAEMYLACGKDASSRKFGLVYLHFAYLLLTKNNQLISSFHETGKTGGFSENVFRKLYLENAENYRSLTIRALVFYSKIKDLQFVGLLEY